MDSTNLLPYQYGPLPSESSIRLLIPLEEANSQPRLVNGSPVLQFRFEIHNINDPPEYEALSYSNLHPLQRFPEEFKHFESDPDARLACVAVRSHPQAPTSDFNEYSPIHRWPVIVEGALGFVSKNCYEGLLQLFGPEVPDPSINHRESTYNKTRLIVEAELGHARAVESLLLYGADVRAVDKFGETALHYAAENGHLETIKVLLQAGASIDVVDSKHRTPVDCGILCNRGPYQSEVHELMRNSKSVPQSTVIKARPRIKRIWVDTVCINSNDVMERNSQVAMMHQIYSSASRVVVWLGHSFNASSAYVVTSATYPENTTEYSRYVTDLSWRSWFYRAWTAQEVAAARDIAMYCGRLEVMSLSPHIIPTLFFHGTSGAGMAIRLNRDISFYKSEIEQLRPFLQIKSLGSPPVRLSWSALLFLIWGLDTSDPRDKIFSIFSLAQTRLPIPAVDYTRSATDLFLEVGRALVIGADYTPNSLKAFKRTQPSRIAAYCDSNTRLELGPGDILGGPIEPLEVLGHVQDNTKYGFGHGGGLSKTHLPSWCPDFAHFAGWPAVTWTQFNAAGHPSTATFHTSDPRILKLEAFLLDEITDVQYDFVLAPGISQYERDVLAQVIFAFRAQSELLLPDRNTTWIDAFLCTALMNTSGPTTSAVISFRKYQERALLTDCANALHKYGITECLPAIQAALANPKWQPVNDSQMTPYRISEALKEIRVNVITRTMFRTKRGYLGVGLRYFPRVGDEVFMFKGGRVPYLLRLRRKGVGWNIGKRGYTYAGDCFIHGVMDGEAVQGKEVRWKPVEIY